MKKATLLLALILLALVLAGCGSDPNSYPEASTNPVQKDPMTLTPTDPPSSSQDLYDPAVEEDTGGYQTGAVYDDYGNAVYAGATPIPLDPVDMPTATPRPALAFTYGAVSASNLGLEFEAPLGWLVDSSASDTIVLTDPNMYDNINATLIVRVVPVASGFSLADVKTHVRDMLKELGQYNYNEWTTTTLAARTLLKKDGYYANYRGVMYDQTVVRGRVMVALLDGSKIITVHMSAPGWYNESYMNVLGHFRDTLKAQ